MRWSAESYGILIWRWNKQIGTETLQRYPADLRFTDRTVMNIYSTHEYSGEAGMVSLLMGTTHIASYYTGPDNNIYISLFMPIDIDPDVIMFSFHHIARVILIAIKEDNLSEIIEAVRQKLADYSLFFPEQLLALSYYDEKERSIIKYIRNQGVISESELQKKINESFSESFFDFNSTLRSFVENKLILRNQSNELVFLLNDILILRQPPIQLLKNSKERDFSSQFVEDFSNSVEAYFQTYNYNEEDSIKLANLLLNPQLYEVLKVLRVAIYPKDDIQILRRRGVSDLDNVLQTLLENEIIQIIPDENGKEYYALLSEPYVDILFPEYILNAIISNYNSGLTENNILLRYLNIIKEHTKDERGSLKKKVKNIFKLVKKNKHIEPDPSIPSRIQVINNILAQVKEDFDYLK
jgi:hypothetical protein